MEITITAMENVTNVQDAARDCLEEEFLDLVLDHWFVVLDVGGG